VPKKGSNYDDGGTMFLRNLLKYTTSTIRRPWFQWIKCSETNWGEYWDQRKDKEWKSGNNYVKKSFTLCAYTLMFLKILKYRNIRLNHHAAHTTEICTQVLIVKLKAKSPAWSDMNVCVCVFVCVCVGGCGCIGGEGRTFELGQM
jgi:hypothetical protein